MSRVVPFPPSVARRRHRRRVVGLALLGLNMAAAQAAAPVVFDIPAGALSQALVQFSQQSGWTVKPAAALVAQKRTPGVRGTFTPTSALQALLADAGLEAVSSRQGHVELRARSAPAPVMLDAVEVIGVHRAFMQAGAHSSRPLGGTLESVDDVLRRLPGTHTQLDPLQGMLSVNLRGMSGLGRVNTMIDGVSQTYYGVAPASYHGAGANTASGVLVDPNFLVGVDVTRGPVAGASGVNALAGSANFRTLAADDVLRSGRRAGALVRTHGGNNGLGRSAMVALAGRADVFAEGQFSVLAALSGSRSSGRYRNGAGERSETILGEDAAFLAQRPRSSLYKLTWMPTTAHRAEFSQRDYRTDLNRRATRSTDTVLHYNYAPAGSDWINVNVRLSDSRASQRFQRGAPATYTQARIGNQARAFDIHNTSQHAWSSVGLTWLVGATSMQTRYQRSYQRDWEDEGYNALLPQGRQRVSALYSGLALTRGPYLLHLNLNYSDSHVSGFKPACPAKVQCFPQGEAVLSLRHRQLNPSATFAVQVTDWLQPFVSYGRSTRAPNVREVFFGNEGPASMNPFLKPERAATAELGANLHRDNWLRHGDRLRLKALAYRTRIRDYITSESFFLCSDGSRCKDINDADGGFNAHIAVNTTAPVSSQGYELELLYDAGPAYLGASFSVQRTNQPTSIVSTTQLGFGYDDFADLPRRFGSLDLGARLLQGRLVLGTQVHYTGSSQRLSPEGISLDSNRVEKAPLPRIPMIVDVYANYQASRALTLRAGVKNIGNRNYAAALQRWNQDVSRLDDEAGVNPTARGRTWQLGAELRF